MCSAHQKQQWQDGGQVNQAAIPEYCVVEDKYAAGYIAGLQRQKRLKQYINKVYAPTNAPSNNINLKLQAGQNRPTKRQTAVSNNPPQRDAKSIYENQKHRFSSSNLDERSVNTEDQIAGQERNRQQVPAGVQQSVKQ